MKTLLNLFVGLCLIAPFATEAVAADKAAKTVLVAVDLSSSTVNHRADYVKYFRMILDTISEGDTLAVLKIADRPGAGESVDIGPMTIRAISLSDNARRIKAENLQTMLSTMQSFESLVAARNDVKPSAGETPIIAVTQSSVRLFEIFKNERKVLVYLSDMLESSKDTANFESSKPPFNQKLAEEVFKKIQRDNRISSLGGVTIYVAGARDLELDAKNSAVSATRKAGTKWFWSTYFSAAGASLKSSAYGPDLLGFSANECNTPNSCENGFFATGRDKLLSK